MIKVNSPRGAAMLEACSASLVLERVAAEKMDACHPGMGMPAMPHPNRSKILEHAGRMPVDKLLGRYAGMPLKQQLRGSVIRLLKALHLHEKIREIRSKF